MKDTEELSEITRAEDILLGALGFADDARLDSVRMVAEDLILEGIFQSDGEKFKVKYDCELSQLEKWAIEVLQAAGKVVADVTAKK